MSSGGPSPPGATGGTSESPANTNKRGNQCCNCNNKNHHANHETKFEGKCSELKGSVYDVVSGKDSFTKTTRDITKNVGHEFNNAREFHTRMVELQLSLLIEPVPPTNVDQVVKFELWKMAWCTYEKQLKARHCNSARVYALVIGQCSQALCNRMEANDQWSTINKASNVIRASAAADPELHDPAPDVVETSTLTHGCGSPSVCFLTAFPCR
jgi:hypothetical protein